MSCFTFFFFTEKPVTEITDSFRTASNVINLMSKNYLDPEILIADANNINCSFYPVTASDKPRNISVTIYEFSPFVSTKHYCMYLNRAAKPVVCSGSRKFLNYRGTLQSTYGLELRMTLEDSSHPLPYNRFWIIIEGSIFSN